MFSSDHILILAAGRGTRMGGPKANMMVEGRPWWQHQAEKLAAIGLPCTWVVSKTVQRAFGKRPLAPSRVVLVDPSLPMTESVITGVESLCDKPPRGVFILPVDIPVPCRQVFEVLSAWSSPAIPTHADKRGHPVYLPWPWVQRNLVGKSQRRTGEHTIRLDFLVAPDAQLLEVDDPCVTMNINTPAQLEQATEIIFLLSRQTGRSKRPSGPPPRGRG